jgi:hypothetical protein
MSTGGGLLSAQPLSTAAAASQTQAGRTFKAVKGYMALSIKKELFALMNQ